jgi:eukaryotic-like serine/threonine-protein kinase
MQRGDYMLRACGMIRARSMSLSPGTRVGPYEVVGLLGVGGMGEVVRARDIKLNRDVALKVLPELVAHDPDRLARFQREAQVLAALNHPNIAHIHGFEDSGSTHAIVMEVVEGPTLADRIAQGPIALDETAPIARQIAEALEAAHELGIVHRDLKPANIKVRDDGTVKVLDFGLAKAMDSGVTGAQNPSDSPTLTARATQLGMILGTAAYMAPEQAKGRPVDKRADIWAFGVVIHEMLTGDRCFKGEDVSETLASVLKDRPSFEELPAETPERLRRLLARCLERDPKQRLRDIGEARVLLSEIERGVPDARSPVASLPAIAQLSSPPRSNAMPWILAGVLAVALVAAIVLWAPWTPVPPAQVMRFSFVPPASQSLAALATDRSIVVSPLGTHVAYVTGQGNLMIRPVDGLAATQIAGVTVARSPFFSPDGQWVGFFDPSSLKRVAITGGPATTIRTLTSSPRGASWVGESIVFATSNPATGLLSVPVAGGEATTLTTPEDGADHMFPSALPGGRAVLFTIGAQDVENSQIAVLDMESGKYKVLIRGGSQPEYVEPDGPGHGGPGYIVYGATGTLRAVRFDLQSLELRGEAVPVLDQVRMGGTTGATQYGISRTGTLVFVPGQLGIDVSERRSLAWIDRQGKETAIAGLPPRGYYTLQLSPDGMRAAVEIRDQDQDIWIWDIKGEKLTRLTIDKAQDGMPIWSPDSRRIVYRSTTGGSPGNVFWMSADGTGSAERLTTMPTRQQTPTSFALNGALILMTEIGPNPSFDMISALNLTTRETKPLLNPQYDVRNAEVSPDGRFLLYESLESTPQIFVRPFPDLDSGRWQISTNGGIRPTWAPGGREVFYVQTDPSGTAGLMAAPVNTTAPFSAGKPAKLFGISRLSGQTNGRPYDVSNDGRQFLVVKEAPAVDNATASAGSPMVFVVNWFEDLKAKVGVR